MKIKILTSPHKSAHKFYCLILELYLVFQRGCNREISVHLFLESRNLVVLTGPKGRFVMDPEMAFWPFLPTLADR